ncbi:hypothetical protein M271_02880 [Streptomyces rapamycinicus NRRL 5491]|nr:hypothetical protein M271_02880 [Streptomyces rapamycinicus NRRL 5491]
MPSVRDISTDPVVGVERVSGVARTFVGLPMDVGEYAATPSEFTIA